MLPLVNRRWARALSGPSHAWRSASLGNHEPEQQPADHMVGLHWFTKRPGYDPDHRASRVMSSHACFGVPRRARSAHDA